MKQFLLLVKTVSLLILSLQSFSQQKNKDWKFSVYGLFSYHPKPKFHTTSGTGTFIAGNPQGIELGFDFDKQLKGPHYFRTGIRGHMFMYNELNYGVRDGEKQLPYFNHDIFYRGVFYIDMTNVSIPLQYKYEHALKKNYSLMFITGPLISFYFPITHLDVNLYYIENNGNIVKEYAIQRRFNDFHGQSFAISKPKIEWDFQIEVKKKFARRGAIGAGFKYHIGTKRLEKSVYQIYPNMPDIRSEGNFSMNRNYFGGYISYSFGKNKLR